VLNLPGTLQDRERDGALTFFALLALMAVAAFVLPRVERRAAGGAFRLPRLATAATGAAVACLVILPVIIGHAKLDESPNVSADPSARLSSIGSNRYAYWRVAVDVGLDHPLEGAGTSSFQVEWPRRRHIEQFVHDAHSFELEAFAELGVIGLALVALLFSSVGLVARRVHQVDPGLAAGPIAALAVWALHASIDWDWEMPAVTLLPVALVGMLVARCGLEPGVGVPAGERAAPGAVSDDGSGPIQPVDLADEAQAGQQTPQVGA
jgi:uncharacterized membrane protein YhaH (DUF805 family)